jgi:hypothetical protein
MLPQLGLAEIPKVLLVKATSERSVVQTPVPIL